MVRINQINNGRLVGMAVLEINAIPYYELLDRDPGRAGATNRKLFYQILKDFYRRRQARNMAIELLLQSVPVEGRAYNGQVHQYIILRQMGNQYEVLRDAVQEVCSALAKALENKNYTVRVFETAEEFSAFENQLREVDNSSALAIAKRERVSTNMFYQGRVYCTDVITPSENVNISEIINALSRHPNSAVSLQMIPTKYQQEELTFIDQTRRYVNYTASNMQFGQDPGADANMKRITEAFEYYIASESEPLYYFNFLVYSQPGVAVNLAGRVIKAIDAGEGDSSALELVDVSSYGLRPGKKIDTSPWAISNILVYKIRDNGFWMADNAPKEMIRAKYLMTAKEAVGVFKLPIDDNYVLGVVGNRHRSVASGQGAEAMPDNGADGPFKLGLIVGENRGAGNAHGGIDVNEYAKHGLILGMSGSGKTNFSMSLLYRIWQDYGIPFLAIEPTKKEYRALIDGIPELRVFTPGKKDISPYMINPFIPPKGITVENYIPGLVSAFQGAFALSETMIHSFAGAIYDCYNLYGWKGTDTSEDPGTQPFGLYEFVQVFKKHTRNPACSAEMRALLENDGVTRLVRLIEENGTVFDSLRSVPIEDLLERPTVIELDAINHREQKALIMALTMVGVCLYSKYHTTRDGALKNILLMEEAGILLGSRNHSTENAGAEALGDLIAESRSYGTGLIFADPSPAKIGKRILTNANVKMVFKLVDKESKDAVAHAMGISGDRLSRLVEGEAMLSSGRIREPLQIMTYALRACVSVRPVISDEEIAQRELYWKSGQDRMIPHRECKYHCDCCDGCDREVRENAEFIAARLVSEYAYQITDEERFIRFLAQMDPYITKAIREMDEIQTSRQLYNCVKTSFLRKVMLSKNFRLNNQQYQQILNHPKFLKKN